MTLKPKRAGTPGGGTMLKTGTGPTVLLVAPEALCLTSAVPTCEVGGHSGLGRILSVSATSEALHCVTPVGFPTTPGGNSTTMSFGASIERNRPSVGLGSVWVLR